MNPLTFTWYLPNNQSRQGEYWRNFWSWGGLLGAALLLFCANLASFPWLPSEMQLAQIAQGLAQTDWISDLWFFPTFSYETDTHQPPLGLLLMAIAFHWGGSRSGSCGYQGQFWRLFRFLYCMA